MASLHKCVDISSPSALDICWVVGSGKNVAALFHLIFKKYILTNIASWLSEISLILQILQIIKEILLYQMIFPDLTQIYKKKNMFE